MMLVDTHAHIHLDEFKDDVDDVINRAKINDVKIIITVGIDEIDSKKALEFCYLKDSSGIDLYASAGIHPHEASRGDDSLLTLKELAIGGGYDGKLVAIGECGLDYYRNNSSRIDQIKALEFQLQLAVDAELPVIFHVRDAWDDFFSIIKNFNNTRGVVHSFTGTIHEAKQVLKNNLYFGLNGIMTFTKDSEQLEAVKYIPKDKILLETDCPFLSPEPNRGKRNEPANIEYIAKFIAKLRGDKFSEISEYSTTNAKALFTLK